MQNYSDLSYMVRVDFFKPTGKWYTTEAISFVGLYESLDSIQETCRVAIKRQIGERLNGLVAVILDPFTKHSHPVMITLD